MYGKGGRKYSGTVFETIGYTVTKCNADPDAYINANLDSGPDPGNNADTGTDADLLGWFGHPGNGCLPGPADPDANADVLGWFGHPGNGCLPGPADADANADLLGWFGHSGNGCLPGPARA